MLSFRRVFFCIAFFLPLSVSGQLIDREKFEESVENAQLSSFGREDLHEVLDIVIEELSSTLEENTGTCGLDIASLRKLRQTMKSIGGISINVSRLSVAIDSFGKPGAGFFRGNTKFVGSYDECLGIDTESLDFSMQYCQLNLQLEKILNGTVVSKFPPFTEAVCLPTSCSLSEINDTLKFLDVILRIGQIQIQIQPTTPPCIPQGGPHYTAGAMIMITICFLFVLFTVCATVFHLLMYCFLFFRRLNNDSFGSINWEFEKRESLLSETDSLLGTGTTTRKQNRFVTFCFDVVLGFSLYKTVPAVFSTKQPPSAITSINGMRVISMFWVIMCHTYFFMFEFQNIANPLDLMVGFVTRFSSQSIMNGFFSVDSFFFLSGLLAAYLTFRHMQRKGGRFPFIPYYVHRILRLTPTYMFVLFFYWFVTVHLGNGPYVNLAIGPGSISANSCKDYWWTNLLYINNFYPIKFMDECMGWTWYLANDMQFYVISPLVLIPLYYWLPGGLMAVGTLLAASIGVTGFIAGYYKYTANVFYPLYVGDYQPPNFPDESTEIYGKPYCRISPYLVGIVLGYFLFKKCRIPSYTRGYVAKVVEGWVVHLSLWLVALIIGLANVYGLYWSWHGHELSVVENIVYFMLSRFTWGVTLALVVFVCHNGYGGVINTFLSLPMWIPLSRLTFNAYLVHEMIMLLLFSEFRTTVYYTETMMVIFIIAMVVLSYGAAGVISLFVEFPLSNLESAVFKLCGIPLHSSTRRSENGMPDRGSSPLEATVKIS